jgi:hypothetical protein
MMRCFVKTHGSFFSSDGYEIAPGLSQVAPGPGIHWMPGYGCSGWLTKRGEVIAAALEILMVNNLR